MRNVLLVTALLCCSVCLAEKDSFRTLHTRYLKQVNRLNIDYSPVDPSQYQSEKNDIWNLTIFGEEFWAQNYSLPRSRTNWLNAAIVYRAFCGNPDSPLYQPTGYGYQAVKLNLQANKNFSIKKVIDCKISPKYGELYLLYGQYCSLYLRIIERELLHRKPTPISFQEILFELHKNDITTVLQKMIPTENIQEWFEVGVEKYSSGLYSQLPDDYVREKFKELQTIEIHSELLGKKEVTKSDITTAVSFVADPKTAKAIGVVYSMRAQRLWLDASITLRPAIYQLRLAFDCLTQGKFQQFSKLLNESNANFKNLLNRSQALKKWLDINEIGLTNGSKSLKPFRKILSDKKNSDLDQYLDKIEKELDANKL